MQVTTPKSGCGFEHEQSGLNEQGGSRLPLVVIGAIKLLAETSATGKLPMVLRSLLNEVPVAPLALAPPLTPVIMALMPLLPLELEELDAIKVLEPLARLNILFVILLAYGAV